ADLVDANLAVATAVVIGAARPRGDADSVLGIAKESLVAVLVALAEGLAGAGQDVAEFILAAVVVRAALPRARGHTPTEVLVTAEGHVADLALATVLVAVTLEETDRLIEIVASPGAALVGIAAIIGSDADLRAGPLGANLALGAVRVGIAGVDFIIS